MGKIVAVFYRYGNKILHIGKKILYFQAKADISPTEQIILH